MALKYKILKFIFIITFLVVGSNGQTNLISNGNFSSGQTTFSQSSSPWKVNTWNSGSGALSSGGLLYTLSKSGSNIWDNKVFQEEIILELGQRYILSFDARAIEGNRTIKYGFYDTQKNTIGYAGDTIGTAILTTTQTYSYTFTMMKETDYDVTFAFECGLSSIDLWFDNISLVKVDDNRIPEVIPVTSPTIDRRPNLSWHPALEVVSDYTIQISQSPTFDTLIVNQKVSDTSYTLLADLPIGNIYWRVQGEDSFWSSDNFVIKDARIPTPEQYENPTYTRRPTLKWSKPPVTVSSYTIEIATSHLFSSGDVLLINSVTDTMYTISGSDLPLGEIFWRIKADDSQYSEISSFVVIDNRIPELIPYESPTYNRRPTLTWHPSRGAVSNYQIQIATSQDFSSPEVLLTVTDTLYTCIVDLPIGVVYWRVKGDDSEFSALQTIWVKDSRIPRIIPVDPKLTEDKRQPIKWYAVEGAASYNIQLSDNSNFSSLLASLTLSDTLFAPTADLTAGTIYCRVKSDLVDQWSAVEYFTVLSDTLPILYRYNGQAVAIRRPQLKWKSVDGAVSYKVMYANNSGFVNASVIPLSDTTYTPTVDFEDGSWFWKVSSSRDLNAYSPTDEVVIDLSAIAPVITTQPMSVTKKEGESALFSIKATGSGSLVYQWYKNSMAITNSNSEDFTENSVSKSDSGNQYYCIVINDIGSDTSDIVILNVDDVTSLENYYSKTNTVNINLPGRGVLFSGNPKEIVNFSIIDMKGRVLYKQKKLEKNFVIGKSDNGINLSSGFYFLFVKQKRSCFKKAFVFTR